MQNVSLSQIHSLYTNFVHYITKKDYFFESLLNNKVKINNTKITNEINTLDLYMISNA